ncbi:MAG: hypothetical protein L0387_40855 [Acidobacteria bacterium]|nr:hypothetical protein [Acidobacteriota bacterium]
MFIHADHLAGQLFQKLLTATIASVAFPMRIARVAVHSKRRIVLFMQDLIYSPLSVWPGSLYGGTGLGSTGSRSRKKSAATGRWLSSWRKRMLDLVFIVLVLIFFALSFWYVLFCERV